SSREHATLSDIERRFTSWVNAHYIDRDYWLYQYKILKQLHKQSQTRKSLLKFFTQICRSWDKAHGTEFTLSRDQWLKMVREDLRSSPINSWFGLFYRAWDCIDGGHSERQP